MLLTALFVITLMALAFALVALAVAAVASAKQARSDKELFELATLVTNYFVTTEKALEAQKKSLEILLKSRQANIAIERMLTIIPAEAMPQA